MTDTNLHENAVWQELEVAKQRITELENTLNEWAQEAAEDVDDWSAYASPYFQEKWDREKSIEKWVLRALQYPPKESE